MSNISEANASSLKNGMHPSKSPRYTRKKRLLSSQARRAHSLRDKIANSKCKYSKTRTQEEPLKSNLGGYVEEKFPTSYFGAGENSCEHLPDVKINIFQENVDNPSLKRSSSFPMLSVNSLNKFAFSRSCSLLPSSSQDCNLPLQDRPRTLDSAIEVSSANQVMSKIHQPSPNDSSTENVDGDFTFSQRSSTSTLYVRNNSNDSAFSQISYTEVQDMENSLKLEKNMVSCSNRKTQHTRSKSDAFVQAHHSDHGEVFSSSSYSEIKEPPRKSIFEGKQMTVPTECFFPRPHQGQSLTSFLSSNEFNISAELDRENAHFCISEALIAAIEHMKCSRIMKIVEEEEESDEEIRKLTQRIRIRRKERQREKTLKNLVLLSDGKTDTTTSQSASPPISSHSSDFEVDSIGSEDEVEDLELSAHTDSNLNSIKESCLSLSMASLYSDADLHKGKFSQKEPEKKFQETDHNTLSAESVALSLLRRFSEKHLPKASELQWIVSEQEAPQTLLPLPNSWPVSPDTIEEEFKTRIRGNMEWAPPRPQIIFSIIPSMKRKDVMEKQKYRCAGCGMKIEKNYVNRFRYCNYFGKYFCQCCHSNSLAYIPGRILWKWDFTKYYVSKFAWDLLDQMFSDPLFNIDDINCCLYQKNRQLELCRVQRMQLFYLKDFMRTCRKAEGIQDLLSKQSHHIMHEPHMYALSDLVQVKSGDFLKRLRHLVNPCVEHVKQCILCQANGFICEICRKDKDIIFPFQMDKVVLCQVCGSCFHKSCFKNVKCPRCVRIAERKKRIEQEKSDGEIFT